MEKTKDANSLLTRGRLDWKQPKDLLQQRLVSLAWHLDWIMPHRSTAAK
jgi:hypothetical protein